MRPAAAILTLTLALLAASAAVAARRDGSPREFRSTATVTAGASGASPLALVRVTVGQVGRDLIFAARTAGRWGPRQLAADPRRAICLLLSSSPGAPPSREICLRAGRRKRLSLDIARVGADGRAHSARPLIADIARSDGRSFNATFDPSAAGLRGRYAWRAESNWTGPGACAPTAANAAPCADFVPASRAVAAKVTRVRAIGCTRPRSRFVTNGPRDRRAVALTFDDGPSAYTPSLLSVLEREHVQATFFMIGQQIAPRSALVRRDLRDGDVVGNHTWSHPNVAGDGAFADTQLRATSAAIFRASGFRACLFRAPYGAVSAALENAASALGLTTIQWDVDPRDWSLPGTDAIVSRVLSGVRAGSIVLMHDGGGPRGETLAAVPRIIAALRRRGYELDTVPQLVGQTVIYGR